MLLHAEAPERGELGAVVAIGPAPKVSNFLHVLQPFLFPQSPDGQDLYLRQISGELAFNEGVRSFSVSHISFNTYFNSFYEDYWLKHTTVSEVVIELTGSGRFWCNVFREARSSGCRLIARYLVELKPGGADRVRLPVSLVSQGHGHGGRLFVDVETLATTHLSAMTWCTSEPPRRVVSIGVGICTFNREPFVARTIQKLIAAPPEAAVAKVVVVNQGRGLMSEAITLLSRRAGSRLLICEQDNFGGAGGFTRTAIELLQDRSITHILFMDDDIELDPRHLLTTAAFLRYARKDVVLGGHMLDLYRRNILYEAGNSISPDNQLVPNHHDLDVHQLSALTALSRATPSHFNGWWYAAIPAAAFREVGLPIPVFIRGDDMEFGTRLHRAGVDTVALAPGLGLARAVLRQVAGLAALLRPS